MPSVRYTFDMSSGSKKPAPLFDLMSDRHSSLRTQGGSKPVVRIQLQPAQDTEQIGIPGSIPPSETLPESPRASEVRVSRVVIAVCVGIFAAALFTVYSLGFSVGKQEGDAETADLAKRLDGLGEAVPVEPAEQNQNKSAAPSPTQPESTAEATAPPSAPTPAGNTGVLTGDPRQKGFNYLVLGTFRRSDATRAVEFLASNAVQAFAVAVESGGSAANNTGPERMYTVYALPGISTDEYRRGVTKKTNLEAQVARIGAVWQKEHKGVSNFSKTMWDKYD
jgi:cell division septation protein DedD